MYLSSGNASKVVKIGRNGVMEVVIYESIFIQSKVETVGRTPHQPVGASLTETVLSLSQEGTRHISSDFTAQRCYRIET